MIDLSPLHLNEATHTYTWDGKVVPGVTSILQRLGYLDHVPRTMLDAALERGTRVHKACELDDLGELDEGAAADVMGYVEAWRLWVADYGARMEAIERPLYHPTLRYAGKPDRLLTFASNAIVVSKPGEWADTRRRALVDLKSGPFHRIMDAQLAAYGELTHAALGWRPHDRLVVQLRGDGTYGIIERSADDIAEGWALFVSLLSVHNWSMRHL